MLPLIIREDNITSLKVHEWLAIVVIIGIIAGLACLTSFYDKDEEIHADSAWAAQNHTGFEVHVKGAVDYPGTYHLPYNIKMRDLLALAGVSSNADLRRFNLDAALKKGRIINVPARAMIHVHLKGAVKADKMVVIPKGSKLEDLINLAEFSEDADYNALRKKRRLKEGEVVLVPSR